MEHKNSTGELNSSSDKEEETKAKPIMVVSESFTKVKMIGKGDVGKVYLVRHNETHQLYAMKVLDKREMVKRNKVKRVLTEREILCTADHPFIITLYWSFQSVDKLYFVMEYCAGGEFFRMLQKQSHKCLPEDFVRFYAAEVLLALEYLHMMGFIYRDLKPENILLHASGHIRLTDFDLSKAAATQINPQVIKRMFSNPEICSSPELTTNSFVGTAEYIAPEVIKGFGQSSSVDWWTFGILLYEMVYGSTPFKGKSQEETFNQILEGGLNFPEHHSYPVSSTCKSLIKKLLSPDPKKRLGAKGAPDIKRHKFFDKMNFVLIRNITPPIIPTTVTPEDTSNFRSFEEEAVEVKEKDQPEEDTGKKNLFKDFTPVTKTDRWKD